MGMIQSKHDPVLFTQVRNEKVVGAVILHVDDICTTAEKDILEKIRSTLSNCFKMSECGPLDTYISLKVERGKDKSVYLSQKHYIYQIAKKPLPLISSQLTCHAIPGFQI